MSASYSSSSSRGRLVVPVERTPIDKAVFPSQVFRTKVRPAGGQQTIGHHTKEEEDKVHSL